MLTAAGCSARRGRLWDILGSDVDFVLISDPAHLVYFTNYFASPFEFRTNDSGVLAILRPDKVTLVGDNLVKVFLDRAYVDEVVAPVWYEAKRSAPPRRGMLVKSALEVLEETPGLRIGAEFGSVPVGILHGLRIQRPHLDLIDLDPIVRPMRRFKDEDELALLRRSMKAADAGFAAALRKIVPGMTEQDAFRVIQEAVVAEAGEPIGIYGDFVSGERTEQIGGPPSSRVIQEGDLFLLDMSAVHHGYRGDYANTHRVGLPPTPWQRERFQQCLGAMAAGEAMLRPGVSCRDVDAAVRGYFVERGLGANFPSHSGHGLGLGHPEPPYIVRQSDDVLAAGDVVALEPGQYVAGEGGMRFERNYLITSTGFEVLSGHELTIEGR